MGQKVNPNALRLGITTDWSSRWYASNKTYGDFLGQDLIVRKILNQQLPNAAIAKIEIERTRNHLYLVINTAKPGMVLGQKGANIAKLELALRKALHDRHSKIVIKVNEVRRPELDAKLVAEQIAKQLENRASFRLAQKSAIRRTLRAGAKGIKTKVAGRLNGADMARTEGYAEGTVPLATFRNDIDYACVEARTTYGQIGVKVWICRGQQPYKSTTLTLDHHRFDRNDRNDRNNRNRRNDRNGHNGGGGRDHRTSHRNYRDHNHRNNDTPTKTQSAESSTRKSEVKHDVNA